jgi:hypothetical protein
VVSSAAFFAAVVFLLELSERTVYCAPIHGLAPELSKMSRFAPDSLIFLRARF